jgi:hypothetical protein
MMSVMAFISWPLTPTLNVIERQGSQLAWDIGRSILVVGAMLVCIRMGYAARWTILAYALAMSVGYAAHLVLSNRLLLRYIEDRNIEDQNSASGNLRP